MNARMYEVRRTRVEIRASSLPPPLLTYDPRRGLWTLEETYAIQDGPTRLVIRAPFEFDLSSVPRIFWSLIAPFELSITAPLVHDFLYQYVGEPPPGAAHPPRRYTRADADWLFLRLMRAEGVVRWRRVLAFIAVRLFAGWFWRVRGIPIQVPA